MYSIAKNTMRKSVKLGEDWDLTISLEQASKIYNEAIKKVSEDDQKLIVKYMNHILEERKIFGEVNSKQKVKK
jgi:hypothetical protein